ncbi:MAG: response regulator [Anaerolineae bacterium]|nr:response regulator [Anaerolineae bacterium]
MSIHVVHIEDDQALQEILKSAYEAVAPSAVIQQFAQADSALPYIEEHCGTIDLFVIAIQLPGMTNGLQLAQQIRVLGCPGSIILTSTSVRPSAAMLESLRSEYYPKPWHIYDIAPRLLQYQLPKAEPPATSIAPPPDTTP